MLYHVISQLLEGVHNQKKKTYGFFCGQPNAIHLPGMDYTWYPPCNASDHQALHSSDSSGPRHEMCYAKRKDTARLSSSRAKGLHQRHSPRVTHQLCGFLGPKNIPKNGFIWVKKGVPMNHGLFHYKHPHATLILKKKPVGQPSTSSTVEFSKSNLHKVENRSPSFLWNKTHFEFAKCVGQQIHRFSATGNPACSPDPPSILLRCDWSHQPWWRFFWDHCGPKNCQNPWCWWV